MITQVHKYDFYSSGPIPAWNFGGNGALGEISYGNNIDISNKNFNLVFSSINYKKNINILRYFPGSYYSNSLPNRNTWEYNYRIPGYTGENGNTGGSATAFGIIANGGRGGHGAMPDTRVHYGTYQGETDNKNYAPSYGEGPYSGYPGINMNGFYDCSQMGKTWQNVVGCYLECGNSHPAEIQILDFRYK